MEMCKTTTVHLIVFGLLAIASQTVHGSDPDLTTDLGINSTNAGDFTFTGLRNPQLGSKGVVTPNFATFNQVKGLAGLGISAVLFEFGPYSQINPHTHPRATEIFFVLSGVIDAGFVDTTNTLFQATLYTGDLFVFPKGLLHFQRNNQDKPASAYSALSSENPGVLQVANALFTSGGTGLPENVLAAAFATSTQTVDAIKATLSKPASPGRRL